MVSVDISLTPSLPGATLPAVSLSLNKRILGDFMGLCFFGRIRSNRKEGVTRIPESTHGRVIKRERGTMQSNHKPPNKHFVVHKSYSQFAGPLRRAISYLVLGSGHQ